MKKNYLLFLVLCGCLASFNLHAQRQMETLTRGLVAVRTDASHVYVGWRLFGSDPQAIAFNLYRDGTLLNSEPITGATNFLDETASDGSYFVKPVLNGAETGQSETVGVWSQNYLSIPLQIPAGGTTPDGVNYTYNANDCSVGDVDGDGEYEVILKWDPTNSKDNSQSGYTGNVYLDAYKLDGTRLWRIDLGRNIRAGAHYTQFMVYDLDGDGKAEVACKTADGTIDGTGVVIGDPNADYRNSAGYVLAGPEFLTVFNGETGAAMATTNYDPPRGNVGDWGDTYGNRVDRFLAGVAYLDGQRPSLVMCRGYYTRTVLAAWDWRNGALTKRWVFDSNNGYSNFTGQGDHSLSVADIDGDGKDEIVYGAMVVDDNGTGLYSTGLGHGDALHVGDLDPEREGLEIFTPHESGGQGVSYRDAATGEILWQHKRDADVGRGLTADIDSTYSGEECWAASGLGTYNNKGEVIGPIPSINFAIWWDGDDMRELLDGTRITKYNAGTLFSSSEISSNNGTKATPNLQADLYGDWREEVIWRTSDNTALRIYINPVMTNRRIYTLMHDPQYRLAVAWQNVGYNQPPHPSFFIGHNMAEPPPSPMVAADVVWNEGATWDAGITTAWLHNGSPAVYNNGDAVLFDIAGSNANPITLTGTLTPSLVTVYSPKDYIFNGPGSLSGSMSLTKNGDGTLTLNADNDYTGSTIVWNGTLLVNGNLSGSAVTVKRFAGAGGNGTFGQGITVEPLGKVIIGLSNTAGTLTVVNHFTLQGDAVFYADLSDDPTGVTKANDNIVVDGDLTLTGTNTFQIHMLDGELSPGMYTLITYSGTFSGSTNDLEVKGIPGVPFNLLNTGSAIVLEVIDVRDPATIVWKGGEADDWDLVNHLNWLNQGTPDWFVAGDSVVFKDSAVPHTTINKVESLPIGNMYVNASVDYTFEGDGTISGTGSLIKTGKGTLILSTDNTYSGATIVNRGTLEIPSLANAETPSPIGASTADSSKVVLNGATLRITGTTSSGTNRSMTIGDKDATIEIANASTSAILGGVITGSGKLIKTGPGTLNLGSINTYNGSTILKEGTLYLGSEDAISSGLGADSLIIIKGGTLSMLDNRNTYSNAYWDVFVPKGDTATWRMDSRCAFFGSLAGKGVINVYIPYVRSELFGDWSGFEGQINVTTDNDGGLLILGNENGYGKASINMTGRLTAFYRYTITDTLEIGELSGNALSQLGAGGEGAADITWKIGGKNTDAVFDGIINHAQFRGSGSRASIIKTGWGSWTLTNANVYTGPTTVEKGKLIVNNASGSGTGSGNVSVNTWAALAGNGTIAGKVTLANGARLYPGDDGVIDTLTINNDLVLAPLSLLEIDVDDNGNDLLQVSDTIHLDGILKISVPSNHPWNHWNRGRKHPGEGDFEEGDSLKIIDAFACTGQFKAILPDPGRGLIWDTSDLCSTGVIRVVNRHGGHSNAVVYPNPTTGNIFIDLSSIDDRDVPDYVLITVESLDHGSEFAVVKQTSSPIELDLSRLRKGVYVIKVKLKHSVLVEKVIKN